LIDDVADRFFAQNGERDVQPEATSKNLARLIEFFGKQKIRAAVPWR
jgi:hypothetical protein